MFIRDGRMEGWMGKREADEKGIARVKTLKDITQGDTVARKKQGPSQP